MSHSFEDSLNKNKSPTKRPKNMTQHSLSSSPHGSSSFSDDGYDKNMSHTQKGGAIAPNTSKRIAANNAIIYGNLDGEMPQESGSTQQYLTP